MNAQIVRIFGLLTVLFAVLIGFTSWWSIVKAEELEDEPANRRTLLESAQTPRGTVLAADGTELAVAEEVSEGDEAEFFTRRYPEGSLFAHAVGYAFLEQDSAGLEDFYGEELAGIDDEFESLLDALGGGSEDGRGDDLHTNLDPAGQQAAIDALAGSAGSVVALEPDTGAVRVMVSLPDFDPNAIPDQRGELDQAEGSPVLNRATQSGYPPGSTFKVVTAAAALDSGEFSPDSVLDGSSPQEIGGASLENFGGQSFGSVTLTEALTNSINTVFATVGEELGPEIMGEYMERFGLGSEPPLDYPSDQLVASGVFVDGEPVGPDETTDIGRVAIGQANLLVTPLQMAMVAAAVANDGSLMAPRLGDEVIAPDGRVTDRIGSAEITQVMSEESAEALTQMMAQVVQEGTGTAAALSGVEVAGKSGTAEVDGGASNQAWFIAFAPIDDPEIAVAATIERTQGTGGEEAAPIVREVIETLLGGEADG